MRRTWVAYVARTSRTEFIFSTAREFFNTPAVTERASLRDTSATRDFAPTQAGRFRARLKVCAGASCKTANALAKSQGVLRQCVPVAACARPRLLKHDLQFQLHAGMRHIHQVVHAIHVNHVHIVAVAPTRGPRLRDDERVAAVRELRPAFDDCRVPNMEGMLAAEVRL